MCNIVHQGNARQNRFTPTRMARQMITSVGEDMRKLGMYVAGVNVKWCSCLENSLAVPYKVNEFFDTAVSLLGVYPRETETYVLIKPCTHMFIAI